MKFDNIIKKRASIRRYKSTKLPIEQIIKIINTANLAPSPGNLAILRYIIIEDSNKISKIAQDCQQEFIKKAPLVIVVCSEAKQTKILYNKKAEKYIQHHAGAAIENLLLKITELSMVSCWVGAFSEHLIKNTLNIPASTEIEAIIPLGYPIAKEKIKQRPKPRLQGRIFFESYGNAYQKPFRKIGET